MKNSVAILDLGTRKMTVLIGERGINNSISIDGVGIANYAGYTDGNWIAPESVAPAVSQAIANVESSSRVKVDKLYVGVPGDFLSVQINNVTMSLGKKRRITDGDVDALQSQGNDYYDDPEWKVINIQPVYYTLDDERKLIEPVGMTSTKLGGCMSYTLCDKEFIKLMTDAVHMAGVPEIDFVSTPLAEVLYLFDDYRRDKHVVLADVGALSTTLAICRGDGVCRQYFFSWGGERITGALVDALDLDPRVATLLKHKVNLSLAPDYKPPEPDKDDAPPSPDDDPGLLQTEYVLEVDDAVVKFDVAEVNDIVQKEIVRFAMYVDKAIRQCDYAFPETTPISITGGGLDIRGASGYLSECLAREVELVKPKQPMFDDPRMSSSLALLDMVLISELPYTGIAGRLRRWWARLTSK